MKRTGLRGYHGRQPMRNFRIHEGDARGIRRAQRSGLAKSIHCRYPLQIRMNPDYTLHRCLFPKTLVSKSLTGAGFEISFKLPRQTLRFNGYVAF